MKSEVSRGRVRPLFYRGSAPVIPPAYGIFLGFFALFGEIDSPSADAKEYPLPVYDL